MPIYNKLVRDRILEVLENEKLSYTSKTLTTIEFEKAIQEKFYEELKEFEEAQTKVEQMGELADILELVHVAAQLNGICWRDLEKVRLEKKAKRGGFNERIFLIEVND